MHTTETLVLQLSPYKVEIATKKLRKYKLPGTDQILEELIQA
jgi:hypothetical protein